MDFLCKSNIKSAYLGIEAAGLESHEMPGKTANSLTTHRVPLVSHRTAPDLRLLKRLLHLLQVRLFFVRENHFFRLKPSCSPAVGCRCRSCERTLQRRQDAPGSQCRPLFLKHCSFVVSLDLLSHAYLASVRLTGDHVAAREPSLLRHQLVQLLHLQAGAIFACLLPLNASELTFSWSPSNS